MAADLALMGAMESDPAFQKDYADARARLERLTTKLRARQEKLRPPAPKAAPVTPKPPPVAEKPAPAARPIGVIVHARRPQPRR